MQVRHLIWAALGFEAVLDSSADVPEARCESGDNLQRADGESGSANPSVSACGAARESALPARTDLLSSLDTLHLFPCVVEPSAEGLTSDISNLNANDVPVKDHANGCPEDRPDLNDIVDTMTLDLGICRQDDAESDAGAGLSCEPAHEADAGDEVYAPVFVTADSSSEQAQLSLDRVV